MGKYFGTDGIRGVAGATLDIETALKIGQSLKQTFNIDTIVIGRDTRKSSDALAMALATGAMNSGIDVLDAGVVATPVIAYYTRKHAMIGAMITASHNPYQDNGIKIFNKGFKMTKEEEAVIETFIDTPLDSKTGAFGIYSMDPSIKTEYQKLYASLPADKANLSVCLDTANGATFELAGEILTPRVDEVCIINNEPDGTNINENCGSTHLESITRTVMENKCDLGFAFDGDGDRVLVVDHNGKLYDGDYLLYIIASYLKEQGKLNKDTVVLTKMSNPGIVKAFNTQGIKVVRTDVGDKYVTSEMFKHGYALGGENSGHIIIKDFLQTGDGILVAAMILNILQSSKRSLSGLCEAIEIYPQITRNIKDVDKRVVEHKAVKQTIKEVQKTLGSDSLLLVRPSGTEPVVRLTVSVRDETLLETVLDKLETVITEYGRDVNET